MGEVGTRLIQFALFGDLATMPPVGLDVLDLRLERVLCECSVGALSAIRLALAASSRWMRAAASALRLASRFACDAALLPSDVVLLLLQQLCQLRVPFRLWLRRLLWRLALLDDGACWHCPLLG